MAKPESELGTGFIVVCACAIVAGVIIGVVGGAFRWCLRMADVWRIDLVDWAHRASGPGWLIPIAATALGATLAAAVVRWMPLAAGSGIQHVEAVDRGDARPPQLRLLPAKFVGGVLGIGSGLVLGREGPTVHMGAAIGATVARGVRLPEATVRMLQTAVGGAGLAVAFNAPIGGALFTLEEVTKSFRLQTVLATAFAAAAAVGCSRLIVGDQPDFEVPAVASPGVGWLPLFIVFGLATGCVGALYNRMVLTFVDHVRLVPRIPAELKAAVIGALIGLVMFIHPLAVGGGDTLTQSILGGHTMVLPVMLGLLALRFVAGPLSYAAAVPGGLFAPLLALGALWGVLFVVAFGAVSPSDPTDLVIPMAIVGMTALFAATVRAPMTGIVLVVEMTATTSVIVPMLAATAASVLAAELLKSPPIYDSLRARMTPEAHDAESRSTTDLSDDAVATHPPESYARAMTEPMDLDAMNRQVISEFRESGGHAGGMFEGKPLVLVHHIGAKSGTERIAPLVPLLEDDRIYVFASKGGADTNPDWFRNLEAHPEVVVELGTETFATTARVLTGDERDEVYERQSAVEPQFAEYQRNTKRVIPVIELVRSTT